MEYDVVDHRTELSIQDFEHNTIVVCSYRHLRECVLMCVKNVVLYFLTCGNIYITFTPVKHNCNYKNMTGDVMKMVWYRLQTATGTNKDI